MRILIVLVLSISTACVTKRSEKETHPYHAPEILLHEHSIPDSRFYKDNYEVLEDNSLVNAYSVYVENPKMYEKYPKGSIYYPIAKDPLKGNTWDLTFNETNDPIQGALNLSYYMFWDKNFKYSPPILQHGVKDLKQIKDLRSKKIYFPIQNYVRDGAFDWFDDVWWKNTLSNLDEIGFLLKEAAFDGIIFDAEEYGSSYGVPPGKNGFWTWEKKDDPDLTPALMRFPKYAHRDFDSTAKKVKERGIQFIKKLNAYNPNATVFLLHGYSSISLSSGRAGSMYGVFGYFIDGLIEGSSENTRIVDLCEQAFHTREWNELAYSSMVRTLEQTTVNKDLFIKKMRVGFPLFRNRMSHEEFKKLLREALELSSDYNRGEAYVWIYGENEQERSIPTQTWLINNKGPALVDVFTKRRNYKPVDEQYKTALLEGIKEYAQGRTLVHKASTRESCMSQFGHKIPDVLGGVNYQIDVTGLKDKDKISFLLKQGSQYVPLNESDVFKVSVYHDADKKLKTLSFQMNNNTVQTLSVKCTK